ARSPSRASVGKRSGRSQEGKDDDHRSVWNIGPHLLYTYFTKTHVGCRSGKAMSPRTAAAATSAGLLTFQRNSSTRLISATSTVNQSPIAILLNKIHAPRIVPMAAA